MTQGLSSSTDPNVLRRLKLGLVPKRYWSATEDHWDTSHRMRAFLSEFRTHVREFIFGGKNILLVNSTPGSGKTSLGVLCLRETCFVRKLCLYIRADQLGDMKTGKWSYDNDEGTSLLERAEEVAVLMIDQCGQQLTKLDLRVLQSVLRARFDEKLSTILAGSESPSSEWTFFHENVMMVLPTA